MFTERTRAFAYNRGILRGEASYIATGRSFSGMMSDFTTMFKVYARSHFDFAADTTKILVAYALYSRDYSFPSYDLANYGLYTLPLWLLVSSCALSPWLFSP